MTITIEVDPKEIVALVVAAQERQLKFTVESQQEKNSSIPIQFGKAESPKEHETKKTPLFQFGQDFFEDKQFCRFNDKSYIHVIFCP